MRTVEIPKPYEIRKAIKKLPLGEDVFFYDVDYKKICKGTLIGFITKITDSEENVISRVIVKPEFTASEKQVPFDQMFKTIKEALIWSTFNLKLDIIKKED